MHFHSADSPDRSCCFCIHLLRSFAFSGGMVGWNAFLHARRKFFLFLVEFSVVLKWWNKLCLRLPWNFRGRDLRDSRIQQIAPVRDAEIPFCSSNDWALLLQELNQVWNSCGKLNTCISIFPLRYYIAIVITISFYCKKYINSLYQNLRREKIAEKFLNIRGVKNLLIFNFRNVC